jgi:hypothetical protein
MRLTLFSSFANMLNTIPVGAIFRALEREQHMIEADLAHQRPVPLKEAESILNFCYYVESARQGSSGWTFTAPLPSQHLDFYRKTLDRLIAAEHLSPNAKAEFDGAIADGSLKQMLYSA